MNDVSKVVNGNVRLVAMLKNEVVSTSEVIPYKGHAKALSKFKKDVKDNISFTVDFLATYWMTKSDFLEKIKGDPSNISLNLNVSKQTAFYPGISAYPHIVRDDGTFRDDFDSDILDFFTQKEVWGDSILIGELLNRLIEPDLLTYCKENNIPINWTNDDDSEIDLTKQDELEDVSFGTDEST